MSIIAVVQSSMQIANKVFVGECNLRKCEEEEVSKRQCDQNGRFIGVWVSF